jgi:hypothetical protein
MRLRQFRYSIIFRQKSIVVTLVNMGRNAFNRVFYLDKMAVKNY